MALLIWAAKESGDERLYEIGTQHAHRFIEFCVRDDGSVIQSVRFDTESGEVIRHYTHKGYTDDSTWARAQAWAMLGYRVSGIWERTASYLWRPPCERPTGGYPPPIDK